MPSKEAFRSFVRRRRNLLISDQWKRLSGALVLNVEALLRLYPHAESFLFFYPIRKEPDLTPLAEELIRKGKLVAFPKVVGKEIFPVMVNSLKELFPGKFGVREPSLEFDRILTGIDVAFIPGLAFDRYGFRIGYGGGYYDRFLNSFPVKVKVGVCFSFQLFEKVPHDPFDVPVDYITTEKFWTRRKEWN